MVSFRRLIQVVLLAILLSSCTPVFGAMVVEPYSLGMGAMGDGGSNPSGGGGHYWCDRVVPHDLVGFMPDGGSSTGSIPVNSSHFGGTILAILLLVAQCDGVALTGKMHVLDSRMMPNPAPGEILRPPRVSRTSCAWFCL
jgi:hypothetical protein